MAEVRLNFALMLHTGKKNIHCAAVGVLWLCMLVCVPLAMGQAPASGDAWRGNGERGRGDNTNVMQVGPGSQGLESDTLRDLARGIFDPDQDSVDLEEGVLNWKGRTFSLGGSRAARARFERYLATPELDEDVRAYLDILAQINTELSVANTEAARNGREFEESLLRAWRLLFDAGRHEIDGGVSTTIANQVYNAWRMRDEFQGLERARNYLMQERSQVQRGLGYRGWRDERRFDEMQREVAAGTHTGEVWDGVSDATFEAQRLAETQAQIGAMQSLSAATGLQAKLQFQTQILSLLLGRRYEHCIIAASFYRHIFRGSHQEIEVGREQMAEFMPLSDASPTVELLEMLAREAQSDVRTGMRAVENLLAADERYSAIERLQETFFLGEFTAEVLRFPTVDRRALLELYRNLREMQNLADLQDYDRLEELVTEMSAQARDFPASRVLSAIRSAQRVSNLNLLAAKQAIANGQFERGEAAMKRATEVWPLNPGIKNFTLEMVDTANLSTQASRLFDEFMEREDERAVFERRMEFGAAFIQDPVRAERLRTVVEKLGQVEMLLAQAREIAEYENPHAAWEMLLAARRIAPDDVALARAEARLVPRVAAFANLLEEARISEQSGDYALSLARYLAAQDIYPVSRECRQGIERVSARLLNGIARANDAGMN